MNRERRLTRPGQFTLVKQRGKSWPSSMLVLRAYPNSGEVTRFGFTVSKRVGNAVVRNKIKRRLKEIVRKAPIKEGWDIVIVSRQRANEADYKELHSCLLGLLKRARLVAEGDTTLDSGDRN